MENQVGTAIISLKEYNDLITIKNTFENYKYLVVEVSHYYDGLIYYSSKLENEAVKDIAEIANDKEKNYSKKLDACENEFKRLKSLNVFQFLRWKNQFSFYKLFY